MRGMPAKGVATLAVGGGVLLVFGSFLTWSRVSPNAAGIAYVVGSTPEQIASLLGNGSRSLSGIRYGDGLSTLLAGLLTFLFAWLWLRRPDRRSALPLVLFGLWGAGVAVYDMSQALNGKIPAISQSAPPFPVPAEFSLRDTIDVSLGVGIWLCAIGGSMVVASGVLGFIDAGRTQSNGEMVDDSVVAAATPPDEPDV